MSISSDTLAQLEDDIRSKIYNLDLAQDNMFVCYLGKSDDADTSLTDMISNKSTWSGIIATEVSTDQVGLSFDLNKSTMRPQLKSISKPFTVNVTFIEEWDQKVERKMNTWVSNWYNREEDCLKNTDADKFKDLYVIKFVKTDDTYQEVAHYYFKNCRPTNQYKITANYNATGITLKQYVLVYEKCEQDFTE